MLRQYFQRIADNTDFTAWYFGHFYEDIEINGRFYCLYEDIVVLYNAQEASNDRLRVKNVCLRML